MTLKQLIIVALIIVPPWYYFFLYPQYKECVAETGTWRACIQWLIR